MPGKPAAGPIALSRANRFERGSAAAGPCRVGINNTKAGAGQSVLEIEGSIAQEARALGVDQKLHFTALDHGVALLALSERHLILQARATALCHLHTQTFAARCRLLGEERAKVINRSVGDMNHSSEGYRERGASQPGPGLAFPGAAPPVR